MNDRDAFDEFVLHKFIGIVLIFDGIASLVYVWDRRKLWQIGRMVRIALGFILIVT